MQNDMGDICRRLAIHRYGQGAQIQSWHGNPLVFLSDLETQHQQNMAVVAELNTLQGQIPLMKRFGEPQLQLSDEASQSDDKLENHRTDNFRDSFYYSQCIEKINELCGLDQTFDSPNAAATGELRSSESSPRSGRRARPC